jgi:hypothetical protein
MVAYKIVAAAKCMSQNSEVKFTSLRLWAQRHSAELQPGSGVGFDEDMSWENAVRVLQRTSKLRFKSDGQERTLEETMAWDQVLESAFQREVNMVFQGKSKGEWPV